MPSNGFSAEDDCTLGEFTDMRSCVPSDKFLEPLLCCLCCPERATIRLLTSEESSIRHPSKNRKSLSIMTHDREISAHKYLI